MRLKIYFDWSKSAIEPSSYDRYLNIIQVNPYFYNSYPSWAWFVPLIHEVGHWLIDKLIPKYYHSELFHVKLDELHEFLTRGLTGEKFSMECDRLVKKWQEEDK
jgi:hypothetical protein